MRSLVPLVITLVFGAILGAIVWFCVEVFQRALDALDGLGRLVFQIPLIVMVACFCALMIYVTVYMIRRLNLRARSIHPDKHTALYQQIRVRPGETWLDLNAPSAQIAAALARGGKVPAQVATRVMAGAQPLPASPVYPALPDPTAEQQNFRQHEVYEAPVTKEIAVPVGVDAQGNSINIPLEGVAALLVGGLPGFGKSELCGSMLAGLLRIDPSGQSVKIAIIDPKRVDFACVPANMAALWQPVARDIEAGVELINKLWAECQRRFDVLQANGAVCLPDLAAKGVRLPYIACLVDEWASFAGVKEFNSAALNLARMGRAAGIMLILATQRPSRAVVDPDIKACAEATVAFRCRSEADSRVLMDDRSAADLPAVPGRAIVAHGDLVHVHTYRAGIRGGKFASFMASVPRVDGLAPAWQAPGKPVPGVPETVYRAKGPEMGGIPVFRTDVTGPYTAAQIAYIRQRYAVLGSLKAVQRELYDGQEGGYWFYMIRDAVNSVDNRNAMV